MSENNCSHNCKTCDHKNGCTKEKLNEYSSVKKVIAVVSGKGGVGKSLVTGLLASAFNKKGNSVGIIDADITGPSIPKMFGIKDKAYQSDYGILPASSPNGVKVMSLNLMVESEDTPVIWRGPVISGVVKQFWTDVCWEQLDYMFIDMPPGTGDVPLTVFQSLPVDGIVIVTSPQDLVSMIVKKAYNMAVQMNVPVLGLIENYSYIKCPHCDEKIEVFGKSHIDEYAKDLGVKVLAKVPIDSKIADACDKGEVEKTGDYIADAVEYIEKI